MKLLIKILILLALISGATYWYYHHSIYTPVEKDSTEEISFQVKAGQSPKEIAENLENLDLIRSSTSFYFYLKSNKLGPNILAGRFLLNKGMTVPEIIDSLSTLSQSEIVITIPEGLKISQIDEKLAELGLIQPGDFIVSIKNFNGWQYYSFLNQEELSVLELPLEGYIYPDTYFIDPIDFQPNDLIYLALDNFEKKLSEVDLKNSQVLKTHSFQDVIIMASIVEREVFGQEDQKIVAGILWKRLENNWLLGADATLLYKKDNNTISANDLQSDSPYNTRKNLGLPPGPISNPSIETIKATLYPTETEYWYYLTTLDTGEVIYSKTNEEHNQNRTKYLQ